jgi:NADH-quinone oxidoreductase subunit M
MMLTWLILVPTIGGAVAWLAGSGRPAVTRAVALAASVLTLALALSLAPRAASGVFLEQNVSWIPQLGIRYHLALDGLSFLLVLLTAVLAVVAVAASWREITARVGGYYFCLLVAISGVMGVFLARDLFLFYFFWELMLVPMYFLIGIWGHERRVYAALKFFLFTFIASLLMLAGILGLAFLHLRQTGLLTFDARTLAQTTLSPIAAGLILAGFLAAFAVKLPAVPVHTWLADAHTEAPTGGSIVLAGLLLKTGAYGMLRFGVPLFPQASNAISTAACIVGVIGILYGGLLAFAQTDFKRMIAFSSISHMGFVLVGIYSGNELALQGAVVQMLAHGIATPALFLMAGSIQERCHTRSLDRLGGLWETAPRLGGFTIFFALAALGLPGLGNFVGEFLVLLGAYQFNPAVSIVGSLGFIVSVIYALRLVQESVHGPNRAHWRILDLSAREVATLGALSAILLGLGLWPRPVFRAADSALASVQRALSVDYFVQERVAVAAAPKGTCPPKPWRRGKGEP